MADSFTLNLARVTETEKTLAFNHYLNQAFAKCCSNFFTFDACLGKYVKGWNTYSEAFDEQLSKDQNKFRIYQKMEAKNKLLFGYEKNN
jgi:hypothetical protein